VTCSCWHTVIVCPAPGVSFSPHSISRTCNRFLRCLSHFTSLFCFVIFSPMVFIYHPDRAPCRLYPTIWRTYCVPWPLNPLDRTSTEMPLPPPLLFNCPDSYSFCLKGKQSSQGDLDFSAFSTSMVLFLPGATILVYFDHVGELLLCPFASPSPPRDLTRCHLFSGAQSSGHTLFYAPSLLQPLDVLPLFFFWALPHRFVVLSFGLSLPFESTYFFGFSISRIGFLFFFAGPH